jgi:LmbE family N-acetylglucosaminyl deacetylase
MIKELINCNTEIIVLSPHPDDAIFCLGGLLAEIRKKSEITITVYDFFSASNFTKHGIGDVREVSNIRKAEEKSVFRELAISGEFFDYPDSVVRGYEVSNPELDYPDRVIDELDDLVIESITSKLREIFSRHSNRFFFFPSANGNHVDHLCLLSAIEGLLPEYKSMSWAFYEDMPYSARAPFPTMLREKYRLQEIATEIDIKRKIQLIRLYDSQPLEEWLPEIVGYAKNPKTGKSYEKIWMYLNNEK